MEYLQLISIESFLWQGQTLVWGPPVLLLPGVCNCPLRSFE